MNGSNGSNINFTSRFHTIEGRLGLIFGVVNWSKKEKGAKKEPKQVFFLFEWKGMDRFEIVPQGVISPQEVWLIGLNKNYLEMRAKKLPLQLVKLLIIIKI